MKISLDMMRRVVVAVDPAVTSGDDADETGIIVVGEGPHIDITADGGTPCRLGGCTRHGYVLDDRSGKYTPDTWARVVTQAYEHWRADRIIAEGNQGGEMVETVIRTVFPGAPIRRVHARQGKRTRAEPIAALYEQGRIHHCGAFPKLEDQLTTWTPDSGESPDRLDALVWGLFELGLAKRLGARGMLESEHPPCNNCGMPNHRAAAQCAHCGAELTPEVDPEPAQQEVETKPFSLSTWTAPPLPPNTQIAAVQEAIRQNTSQQPWYMRDLPQR